MRPHDNDEDRGAGPRGQTRARLGVAPRCAGEAAARGHAAAFQGFTPALPHAGAARRALEEGGRQLGLRPGPVRTLCALLALYRGWGLRRPPVLAATNAAIARAAGCDERTAQRHLAVLRARGLVLVEYGPHNRRRPEPDVGPGDPTGIDLRPALVAAAALRALLDRIEAERRAAVAELRLARRALLLARAALAGGDGPTPEVLETLEGHRRGLRRARRRLNHPAAAPTELAALRQGLGQLRAALEALAAAPGPAAVDEAVEEAVGKAPDPSPRDVVPGVHQTESNSVETSDGFRPVRSEQPAEPDLPGLTLDELADREIEARKRAHRLGLAARRLNEAIERHGTAAVVETVDHVW